MYMFATFMMIEHVNVNYACDDTEMPTAHKLLIETYASNEITQTLDYRAGESIDKLSYLKYGFDRYILDIMYKSYIRPIIQYDDVIMPSMNEQVQNTESVHKWAGMIISSAINGASSEIVFSELGWCCISKCKKTLFYSINTSPWGSAIP